MAKTATLIDGKKIADRIFQDAVTAISRLKDDGVVLKLATLRAGDAQDAVQYESYLKTILHRADLQHEACVLPADTSEKKMIAEIHRFNQDAKVTGVMIFSPLPKTADLANLFDNIYQSKDVEGRTFLKSHFGVFSPTAHSVMTLIESTGIRLAGKEAVVVGHSDLVGKSTAILLMDRLATVAVCHKETKDLRFHVMRADILVSAAGRAGLIPGSWVKKGSVVIDVGENWQRGKLVGDVQFDAAKKRASFITPVPGGVGPLTNIMLIKNLLRLHELQKARNGNR